MIAKESADAKHIQDNFGFHIDTGTDFTCGWIKCGPYFEMYISNSGLLLRTKSIILPDDFLNLAYITLKSVGLLDIQDIQILTRDQLLDQGISWVSWSSSRRMLE